MSTKVVDVGANPIDGDPPYLAMLRKGEAQVVGFEPQAEALAELNKAKGANETYLPHAVGDGGRHTLHFCSASGMTSLFRPNARVLNLFHGFPQWGQVLAKAEVDTVRLDDVEETVGAHFLKIDIQGAELMVFRNAEKLLGEMLVIQTEVEFLELYIGQPLFSEVELFLRQRGFMLYKFAPIDTRVVQPMLLNGDIRAPLSQILAADAVFIRDLSRLEALSDADLLQMAKILHDCYFAIDVAYHLLIEHDRRVGSGFAAPYLSALQNSPPAAGGR